VELPRLLQHEHRAAVLDLGQREAEGGRDRRRGQLAGDQRTEEGQPVGLGSHGRGGQRIGPAVRALAHRRGSLGIDGGHRVSPH